MVRRSLLLLDRCKVCSQKPRTTQDAFVLLYVAKHTLLRPKSLA